MRLVGGDRGQVTVEGGDPAAAAARFAAEGAPFLHLVDLDGAFSGSVDDGLVGRVARAASGVPVQVGGGCRSLRAIDAVLAAGAARVVVGTAACSPGFIEAAVERWGDRIIAAVDVRDGGVAVKGWTHSTGLGPATLARRFATEGVARLLVTSASRDGSLAGPDLHLFESVLAASGLPVIASGGIASLDDLRAVKALGCESAVVGSALWTGRFSLAQAVEATAT